MRVGDKLVLKMPTDSRHKGNRYILSSVGVNADGKNMMCLVNISSGICWTDAIPVDNRQLLTPEEAIAVCGNARNTFTVPGAQQSYSR